MARDPVLRAVRACARETDVPVRLVGGLVRDAALGRTAHDVDLAAGPGCPRFVASLAARFARRPFRFRKRGVTTWRVVLEGREVDVVDAARRGFPADLARRDFTLNAVAFDPVSGRLEDPLGGLRDLRRGVLRAPAETTFRDDPVRALRAARFLAAFPGFRLHRETAAATRAAASALRRASAERIRDELQALLLAPDPGIGLRALLALGLLPSVLPELVPAVGCAAGPDRPDVFLHTADALGAVSDPARCSEEARVVLRWALLLHDVAKPDTLEVRDGRPTFHGHEVLGAVRAEKVLRRLKHPRARIRRVKRLIELHLRPGHLADAGAPPRGVRRLVRDAGDDLPLLLAHAEADVRGSGGPPDLPRRRRLSRTLRLLAAEASRARTLGASPLLRGDDVMRALGLPPGPQVGAWLRAVGEAALAGEIATREEALAWISRQRTSAGAPP